MYNDYRDKYPPGMRVFYMKGYPDKVEQEAIVVDVSDLPDISIKNYKDDPTGRIWVVDLDIEEDSPGFLTEQSIILKAPLVPLCKCAWNKHPLFCRCK